MFRIILIIKNDNEVNAQTASRILIDIIKHFSSNMNPEKHIIPLYQFLQERTEKMLAFIVKYPLTHSKENIQSNNQKLIPNSESIKVYTWI